MTVKADEKKWVVLVQAKPGARFDVQVSSSAYVLRKLEPIQPKRAKVRFTTRNGYTVAVADQPINEALREALADFREVASRPAFSQHRR